MSLNADNGASSSTRSPAVFIQIFALLLGLLGIAFGAAMCWVLLNPGPSGEWAALAKLFAHIVDLPVAALLFAVGIFVKRGRPALRKLCIIAAVLNLLLPFLTGALR